MFAEHYKKIYEPYEAHEKFIADIIQSNCKHLNKRMDKTLEQVNTNSNALEDLSRKTKVLEKSLILNQDLLNKSLGIFCEIAYLSQTNTQKDRGNRILRKENGGLEIFNNKPKTIIAKLVCYKDKEEILKITSILKDTNCYVY